MSQGSSFNDLVESVRRKSIKDLPPAIPPDRPSYGSSAPKRVTSVPQKTKKPIFERYDTYITCPGCGSLVHKGTKQCECGYDLSGPAARLVRLLHRATPILICVLLIICGTVLGYYLGQKSMEPDLERQYNLGFETGHDTGYKSGRSDGYKTGKQVGYELGYSDAKNDYLFFSNSFDPTMPRLSGSK